MGEGPSSRSSYYLPLGKGRKLPEPVSLGYNGSNNKLISCKGLCKDYWCYYFNSEAILDFSHVLPSCKWVKEESRPTV